MKRIISLMLAIIAIFAFSACSADDDSWLPVGMQLASTDAVDYKLYVPSSWTVDVSTGIISAYVSDTDRSNVTVTAFNLSNDNSTMTVSEYWSEYEALLKSTFPDMTYVQPTVLDADGNVIESELSADEMAGNPSTTLLDGVAANKYYYTATVSGESIEYMQLVAVRGGVAYIITYTATPTNFATHVADVEDIISNFRFKK